MIELIPMSTFEHTIEIEAPVEHVVDFGRDPMNWERTMPSLSIENVEDTEDGRRMDATFRLLGISVDGDLTSRLVEPDEYLSMRFESPGLTGDIDYHYSETDSGTRMVQKVDYEFGDSLRERILAPVAKRSMKRQFKNALDTTKDLVEAEIDIDTKAPVEA